MSDVKEVTMNDINWVCNHAHSNICQQIDDLDDNVALTPKEKKEERRQLNIDSSNLDEVRARMVRNFIKVV